MSPLLVHSGTAQFDLRSSIEVAHDELQEALDARLGKIIPDVSRLEHTAKDWVFQNGIHRPVVSPSWIRLNNNNFFTTATQFPIYIGPGSGPIPLINPFAYGQFHEPPKPLPVEQREMPVVGYRAWHFTPVYKLGWGKKGALSSANAGYGVWNSKVNTATCQMHRGHMAPDEFCTCGFYVLAGLDDTPGWLQMADDTVVGAVMGWGRVVQHGAEGWRAQYAKIIALLDCKFSDKQLANTKAAANSYGLEVKTRPQLEAMVAEFGDPLAP